MSPPHVRHLTNTDDGYVIVVHRFRLRLHVIGNCDVTVVQQYTALGRTLVCTLQAFTCRIQRTENIG